MFPFPRVCSERRRGSGSSPQLLPTRPARRLQLVEASLWLHSSVPGFPLLLQADGLSTLAKHRPTMPSKRQVQFVPRTEDPILPILLEVW